MPALPSRPEILHQLALRASQNELGIREGLIEILRSSGWTASEARVEATRLRRTFELAIDDHLSTFAGRGVTVYYQRSPDRPTRIMPVAEAGPHRLTAHVQAELMALPFERFEVLLGNVLVGTECNEVAVTPPGHDGGFDFIGRLDLDRPPLSPQAVTGASLLQGQSIYLFGQAKRYHLGNPVEVAEIQQLAGAVRILQGGGGTPTIDRVRERLLDWGWERNLPLIHCFATSGGYRSTIPGLARQQRYSIFDGEQLAQRVIRIMGPEQEIPALRAAMEQLSTDPVQGVFQFD